LSFFPDTFPHFQVSLAKAAETIKSLKKELSKTLSDIHEDLTELDGVSDITGRIRDLQQVKRDALVKIDSTRQSIYDVLSQDFARQHDVVFDTLQSAFEEQIDNVIIAMRRQTLLQSYSLDFDE